MHTSENRKIQWDYIGAFPTTLSEINWDYNSESEIINIFLHHTSKARKKEFIYDFSAITIKSRNSKGNILSKYPIRINIRTIVPRKKRGDMIMRLP